MKNIIKLLVLLPLFATTACDDLFEPAIENNRDLDAMYSDAKYALGVLANGYILLPYNTSPTSDVATDEWLHITSLQHFANQRCGNR